jgi:hypothetical protein
MLAIKNVEEQVIDSHEIITHDNQTAVIENVTFDWSKSLKVFSTNSDM